METLASRLLKAAWLQPRRTDHTQLCENDLFLHMGNTIIITHPRPRAGVQGAVLKLTRRDP